LLIGNFGGLWQFFIIECCDKKSCKIRHMKITLNGTVHDCPANTNITELIQSMALQDMRIALEINKEVITRSEYDSYVINEGDTVEIIQAIGGG